MSGSPQTNTDGSDNVDRIGNDRGWTETLSYKVFHSDTKSQINGYIGRELYFVMSNVEWDGGV